MNESFRWGDERIGASVTGSGRAITWFMLDEIEEVGTGKRKQLVKVEGVEKKSGATNAIGENDSYGKWHYIIRAEQLETLRKEKELANPNFTLPSDFVDYEIVKYSDTDSVAGDTLVLLNGKLDTIENHWNAYYNGGNSCWVGAPKTIGEPAYPIEVTHVYPINVTSPCFDGNQVIEKEVLFLYRHKVSKARWKITLVDGKSVIVTNDHSIMVERSGKLVEVKPSDINTDTDICITIKEI